MPRFRGYTKTKRNLKRGASKKGLTGRRRNAYIYGTLNKVGKKVRRKRRK